jgi:hypothetical protein
VGVVSVVVVVVVLSGDVDERLKAGRVRESKEPPRDIGRPNPIAEPFSVVNAAAEAQRESNEFQPNAPGVVGLGDSMSRTPSITCRKVRVGVAERGCCCLPNIFATLDEEDEEGLTNRGEWFRVMFLREVIGVEVDVVVEDGKAGEDEDFSAL